MQRLRKGPERSAPQLIMPNRPIVKSANSWIVTMSFSEARQYLANTVAEWRNVHLSDLQFWHRGEARLLAIGLAALALFLLVARSFVTRQPGRHRLVVP